MNEKDIIGVKVVDGNEEERDIMVGKLGIESFEERENE